MKTFKHLFTALLLLCTTAATAHDFEVDGIYYNISSSANKAVEVTCKGEYSYDYSNEYTGNVVIPESVTYNGTTYSVTSIGDDAFYRCSGLTSITIPNSVTSIGSNAFRECTGLTSIEIGNSVTSIGEWAFYDCDGLTSIVIPNSVTSIGEWAFYDCTQLINIRVAAGNAKYDSRDNCNAIIETETNTLILGCKNTEIPNSVTSIGDDAFARCTGLTSIVIPNSVTSIGEDAFSNCTGLTSIVIPNSVTSIGEDAFWYCTGLTSIVIPNSVTSIGEDAFNGCSGLTSIVVDDYNTKYDSRENCNAIIETETNTLILGCKNSVIPNSVTSIGEDAFSNCTGLTSIVIPNSVTSIGSSAFYWCSGLTSVVIPNSVTSIGSSAFYCCYGLTSIVIPNSVISIGESAFYNCYGLTSITIPNSITSIGSQAFFGCDGLTSIVIPNSVTSIGEWAFFECDGLTGIVIPNSVTSIGKYAFCYCDGLTSVVIGNSVTSIGDKAFYRCDGLTSVVIGNSVTNIGDEAFYDCSELKTVINVSNLTFSKGSSDNGYVAYYADEVYNARDVSMVGDFIFGKPNGVNTLVGYLGNATELTLPADYNGENYVIGNDAFNGCTGLASVVIPGSVTSIGNYAFNGCTSLKELRIEDGESTLSLGYNTYNSSDTGKGLFYDCPLRVLYLGRNLSYDTGRLCGYSPFNNMKTLTSVNIGNCVTSIERNTLYGCSGLASITIPNSVTSIGDYAFNGCTGLKTVFNFSNFTFSKGSTGYGYVAYYADKIYNTPNGSFEGDFIFGKPNDVNTLLYYLGNATELTLPADYKEESYVIGSVVFKGKSAITIIEIPNSVTSIGNGAFSGCSGLTSIVIPNSVTSIGSSAFYGCTGLASIAIPNSVTSVGEDAFAGCNNVEKLNLDCAEVGNWFSGVSVLKEVTIGNSVSSIVSSAFNGCIGLTAVHISDPTAWCGIDFGSADANPLYYAKNLYLNGELLTSLTIPAEVAEVKDYAFYNCNSVTNIDIIDGVKSIGNSAFYGCNDLETLYISNTIENIGNNAFAECNNILEIKIGSKKAITASENIFSSDAYNNVCLYVPTDRKFAYEKTAPWSNFYIVEMDFTGIDEVKAENGTNGRRPEGLKAKVKTIYDLNGRAVENPAKGIYIINGKKVVIK